MALALVQKDRSRLLLMWSWAGVSFFIPYSFGRPHSKSIIILVAPPPIGMLGPILLWIKKKKPNHLCFLNRLCSYFPLCKWVRSSFHPLPTGWTIVTSTLDFYSSLFSITSQKMLQKGYIYSYNREKLELYLTIDDVRSTDLEANSKMLFDK